MLVPFGPNTNDPYDLHAACKYLGISLWVGELSVVGQRTVRNGAKSSGKHLDPTSQVTREEGSWGCLGIGRPPKVSQDDIEPKQGGDQGWGLQLRLIYS